MNNFLVLKKNKELKEKIEKFLKPEVFRDPIYGYIYFDYVFLKKIVDTSVMQRLRRIKQLGCVNIVYHGAEHSRFTHSLGVYELARKFLETNSFFLDNKIHLRTKLLLLTSCLLHDVGHGSYSHIFENIFKTKHEEKSAQIIISHFEINSILNEIDEEFKYDVAAIIQKKSKFKLIEQLLSSQLDFDRLDYLKRDAFFVGVSYGSIDTDRLIRIIDIEDDKIVFKQSGISSIENYLISRYHMYNQVYYHPKVISYSIILEKIFQRIKYLIENNYLFKIQDIILILRDFINNNKDINNYLEIDDFYINSLIFYFHKEKDSILSNLCKDFLNRNIWFCIDQNNFLLNKKKEILMNYKNKEEIIYYTQEKKICPNTYYENKKNSGEHILISVLKKNKKKIQKLSQKSFFINCLIKNKKKNFKFFYRK
ncbi:MAG: HD superfamily phosphohydrolase [Candidatus Phytoplasma cynodontis]|uniref:HD domain-containing protein n=1 Tax='Cynodon dactylon' phytoplasma TaxID=295320 RepID=UPI001265CEC5|nr:HD domain-containing protein ['Cynodon dactylon' phytoplasma]KAB8122073.1 HD domain-containing protein ['Cynodon dactylon' phytoplasma]WIA07511.1 MAG: HD superfamily phosphohydrolase [Candidatus Phytoplasma cynodontis]